MIAEKSPVQQIIHFNLHLLTLIGFLFPFPNTLLSIDCLFLLCFLSGRSGWGIIIYYFGKRYLKAFKTCRAFILLFSVRNLQKYLLIDTQSVCSLQNQIYPQTGQNVCNFSRNMGILCEYEQVLNL